MNNNNNKIEPLLIYPSLSYDAVQLITLTGNYITDGKIVMNGGFISNLNNPILPTDAATKQYVDTHGSIPGGSNGSVQFNDNSLFNGSLNFTWDDILNKLDILGDIHTTNLYSNNADISNITSININSTKINVNSLSSVDLSSFNIYNSNIYSSNINVVSLYVISELISSSLTIGTGVTPIIINNPLNTIYNIVDPTSDTQVANKRYVDSMIGVGTSAVGPTSAIQFKSGSGGLYGTGNLTWNDGIGLLDIIGGITTNNVNNFLDTTDSTSINNGAVVISGGVGINKNVNIGQTCFANAFLCTSDKDLKYEINKINNAQDILKNIKCYSFKLNNDNNNNIKYGVLAQQLEDIKLNSFISESNNHKYVDYLQFIPLLIQEYNDLRKEFTELKYMYNLLLNNSLNCNKNNNRTYVSQNNQKINSSEKIHNIFIPEKKQNFVQ